MYDCLDISPGHGYVYTEKPLNMVNLIHCGRRIINKYIETYSCTDLGFLLNKRL